MTDLGTFPDGWDSVAYAINAIDQIVGYAYTATFQRHAFLYSGGVMHDLNNLLVTNLPAGVFLSNAVGINDRGQIAAAANNGRSYLLTPCRAQPANYYMLLLQ